MIRRCEDHGYFRGAECLECGSTGHFILNEERTERLGKLLTGILRHFPDKFNLMIDLNGWIDLTHLVRAVSYRYRWVTRSHVLALVYSDEKGRYDIKDSNIRATYAHSINVDLDYDPNTLPELFYGTSEEEGGRIIDIGLKPVRQRYVHLSLTREQADKVARFRTDNPLILLVDAEGAQDAGIKIMTVNDLICISDEIPPEYIELIE